MKIVFDLDGVLRDLCGYLETKLGIPYPAEWNWLHEGKDIYQIIKEDSYRPLIYAPMSEYFITIKNTMPKIEIWTDQPEDWRPFTKLWIESTIGDCLVNYLTTEEKMKRLVDEKGIYLVEDSPNFPNYDHIILIDRPYNWCVNTANRITNPKELTVWLKRFTSEVRV